MLRRNHQHDALLVEHALVAFHYSLGLIATTISSDETPLSCRTNAEVEPDAFAQARAIVAASAAHRAGVAAILHHIDPGFVRQRHLAAAIPNAIST
jgi:hypothetical protein